MWSELVILLALAAVFVAAFVLYVFKITALHRDSDGTIVLSKSHPSSLWYVAKGLLKGKFGSGFVSSDMELPQLPSITAKYETTPSNKLIKEYSRLCGFSQVPTTLPMVMPSVRKRGKQEVGR